MNYNFREAKLNEVPKIWTILQQGIKLRKEQGSTQWQNGYPNEEVIKSDIKANEGFVLTKEQEVIGYCAILINNEPAYNNIDGKWITTSDFVVFHRIAVAEKFLRKGLGKKIISCIEEFAISNKINSVKADTNFDNLAMIKSFDKLGYTYCGEVEISGEPRKAYEKVLS